MATGSVDRISGSFGVDSMTREHVGVARCPKCEEWRAFQTDNLETYSMRCWKCDKQKKLKDKQRGGWHVSVKFLGDLESMRDAQRVCNALNKYNAERIQEIINKERRKPPHKRRDVADLIRDVQPRTDFSTYRRQQKETMNISKSEEDL